MKSNIKEYFSFQRFEDWKFRSWWFLYCDLCDIFIKFGNYSNFYASYMANFLIYQNICCFQKFVLIHVIHYEWKQTYPRWEILRYFLNLKTRSLYDVWVKKYKRNAKGQKMSKKLALLISHFLPPQWKMSAPFYKFLWLEPFQVMC